MQRFIFIYSAKSGIFENIPGAFAKAVGGKSSCALCNITHGPLFEKAAWKRFLESLVVPAVIFHSDEIPEAITLFLHKKNSELPVVLREESSGALAIAMTKNQLESCAGDVECVKNFLNPKNTMHDLIIIGSGAAGLSAGLYAGRYRLKTLVLGESIGGETALAGKIENYPGVKPIDGFDLMMLMKEQAESLGVEMQSHHVNAIRREGHCFIVETNEGAFEANSIILALGAERRRLGLPNEKELTGKGIHYCVTCDGPLYRGKTIALVGGGDASVKGINLAASYVDKIYLIVRGKELTAEPINLEQMKKLGNKVEVLFENSVEKIVGSKNLENIILAKPYGKSNNLSVDGLFVEIGAVPNVSLAVSLGVELDEYGYIKADSMMRTNIDGIFSAGDVVNHFGKFKQVAVASALGAVAATSAYEHTKIHGELCEYHAMPSSLAQANTHL